MRALTLLVFSLLEALPPFERIRVYIIFGGLAAIEHLSPAEPRNLTTVTVISLTPRFRLHG